MQDAFDGEATAGARFACADLLDEQRSTRPAGQLDQLGAQVGALSLVALLLGASVPAALAQIDATTYPFTSAAGTALEDMSSGTTQLVGPDQDNTASAVTPIGFEFWFAGVRHTSFSVIPDGLLRLGSTAILNAPTNDLSSVVNTPQIAPYWDNLWVGTNGKVHYKVVGTAPGRKLVVEWQNLQVPRVGSGFTGAATFQCWLHETTGAIQFVYGSGMATNTAQNGASIGIGISSAGTPVFASVTLADASVAYGAANNANVAPIASGTRHAFTPLLPAAPTALAFSQVSALGMTLSWTDHATNEVGYGIWRSTDGVAYDFVASTASSPVAAVSRRSSPLTHRRTSPLIARI